MKYNRITYTLSLLMLMLAFGCSATKKMERGKVIPSNFYEKLNFTTAKGLLLVPCEFEGATKNYLFDTGAQLTGIQRTTLKGKIYLTRSGLGNLKPTSVSIYRT